MQFSVFCMNYSDSFFLAHFTNDNNAEVGVYGIACVFASIILTLCSALLQYVLPKIYQLLSQPVISYKAIKKQPKDNKNRAKFTKQIKFHWVKSGILH